MFTRREFIKGITSALFGLFLPKGQLSDDVESVTVINAQDDYDTSCNRCKKDINAKDAEICWYCSGWLCYDCWDEYGHCGHQEAERQNELARQGKLVNGYECDEDCDNCLIDDCVLLIAETCCICGGVRGECHHELKFDLLSLPEPESDIFERFDISDITPNIEFKNGGSIAAPKDYECFRCDNNCEKCFAVMCNDRRCFPGIQHLIVTGHQNSDI